MAGPTLPGPGGLRAAVCRLAAAASLSIVAGAWMLVQPATAGASVSPATVAARLGAGSIPSELVILVDISKSMAQSSGGLYPQIQSQLPLFLKALAAEEPKVTVAIITFGSKGDTQEDFVGSPRGHIILPANADSNGTDFGWAFKQALNLLAYPRSPIKVGGVMLLSDGALFAPDDKPYASYSAKGWQELAREAPSIGIPITGYDLPLSTDPAVTANVNMALTRVFGSSVVTLAKGSFIDLNAEFQAGEQQVRASLVTAAAAADIGHGIGAAWVSLPGFGGAGALNLGAGSVTARLRLTARTHRIPLTVSRLSVRAAGFPVRIRAVVPQRTYTLAAGRSVIVPVQLTWPGISDGRSFFGGSKPAHGQLFLSGKVTSGYSPAIRNFYGDGRFRVGPLGGAVTSRIEAAIPIGVEAWAWALVLLIVLVLLAAVAGFLARMNGQLVFTSVDRQIQPLLLPRRPFRAWPAYNFIGVPGRMIVFGSAFSEKTHIWLKPERRGWQHLKIAPNGRKMVTGVVVQHYDQSKPLVKPQPVPASDSAAESGIG